MTTVILKGSCLCSGVRFEIDGRHSAVGICHCSKCQKASAASGIAELMTASKSFRFTQGQELIQRYQQPSGYSNAFCSRCGSNLPKPHPSGKVWWIPAGLLDGDPPIELGMHIYVDSKARWDEIGGDAVQYAEDWPERPE
ncbi:MAG: GFA family protein [Myxococcales bacterium]|nr:GFA family protein [Myxococcales bacterium]